MLSSFSCLRSGRFRFFLSSGSLPSPPGSLAYSRLLRRLLLVAGTLVAVVLVLVGKDGFRFFCVRYSAPELYSVTPLYGISTQFTTEPFSCGGVVS